jgi:hypothetical protein
MNGSGHERYLKDNGGLRAWLFEWHIMAEEAVSLAEEDGHAA